MTSRDSLKRPSPDNPGENCGKISRSPQTYISAELYKRLSQDEIKQAEEKEEDTIDDKWKTPENNEKRFCKICEKEAQFLCSGCRRAWYCSQICQVRTSFL